MYINDPDETVSVSQEELEMQAFERMGQTFDQHPSPFVEDDDEDAED